MYLKLKKKTNQGEGSHLDPPVSTPWSFHQKSFCETCESLQQDGEDAQEHAHEHTHAQQWWRHIIIMHLKIKLIIIHL